jgi:hypothetical protein
MSDEDIAATANPVNDWNRSVIEQFRGQVRARAG